MESIKGTFISLPESLSPYFNQGLKIVIWFFIVPGSIIFILHAGLSVAHPYSLDYGEAPLINQAMRLKAGETIYRPNLETPPFTIANYPPIYILSLIPFLDIFESPFHVGRIISVIASLASALFLGLTNFHFYRHRLSAITTGILFISFPYVVEWSGRARIDCLALAFATAAIYIFAHWPRSRLGFLGGGLLLVAAAYTRQSYALAAPLAAFCWLWTQKKVRALQLALYVGGLGAILFLAINIFTGGGFYYNIITANVNEFGWDRLVYNLEGLWKDAGILLVLAAAFLALGWKSIKGWALGAAFLVGASLSALTIGKIGSNINYFLELSAALSLVGGALIVWSKDHPWRHTLILLLISLQFGMLMQATMNVRVDWILTPRRADFKALQRLEQVVLDMDGPVPADEYMGMLTMNDRPLYIQPFEVSQLANDGMWDQEPFLGDIASQEFEGILIHHFGTFPVHKERWTPEMLAAIEAYYRPTKTLAGTVVFQPQLETEISSVPPPSRLRILNASQPVLGPQLAVSNVSNWSQPDIAINPKDPDHLAVFATHSTQFDCRPPNCRLELMLYISLDGGGTWTKTQPFSGVNNAFHNGQVDFNGENTLYAFGTRDNTLTINSSNLEADYTMSRMDAEDITRAQVAAKPWFRIHPDTGRVFVTLDAQEEDMLFVTPSIIRSSRDERPWTTISRADLRVSVGDFNTGRATWPDDIQILFGEGDNVSLVWTWGWEPWTWPRTVWMANSSDGGDHFGEPSPILETWGPINATSEDGTFAIAYRTGDENDQSLAVAVSSDNGYSWSSRNASGNIHLSFDPEKGPGIDMAPDGTIDLVFYVHIPGSSACIQDIQGWQETIRFGQVDPCNYNIYYSYSPDGGRTFSEPIQVNGNPVQGESLARFEGRSNPGTHLAIASSNEAAYPLWIATPGQGKTQATTMRITR